MHPNFTIIDLEAASLATILFSIFAIAPGYALGWVTNVFSFRGRLIGTRLLLAVAISWSVCPAFLYWSGMLLPGRWIWLLPGAWTAITLFLLIREHLRGFARPDRSSLMLATIVAGWTLVAIGSLVDLDLSDRLYFSPTAHDYSVRALIAGAISRAGVRPMNPMFYPDASVPLRYHYFSYIPCGLLAQLGGRAIEPRQALIAATVWCGIGLIAIIPLYLRFFDPKGPEAIHRRSLIGIGLLGVTGLDLIPTALLWKFGGVALTDLDWWNEQIASWLHSLLWVPHHVVALIACMTGFLLLWRAADSNTRIPGHVVLAALAFTSAAGSSIYVTLVFAVFLTAWALIMGICRCYRNCLTILCTGLFAGALSLPHLLSLSSDNPGSFVAFAVRGFSFAEILFTSAPPNGWLVQTRNAIFLPLNYLLELGFFFVVGWLVLKRMWQSERITRQQVALSTMLIISVFISSFVRSTVISNNDLGWRGFLVAQFVLILFAVEFWQTWPALRAGMRRCLVSMLVLGVAGTVYQCVMLRVYPILVDHGLDPKHNWLAPDRQLGQRTMAMRQAYSALDEMLPQGAVVQFNPYLSWNGYFYGMYANRQSAAFDKTCGSTFGGRPVECDDLLSRFSTVFLGSAPMRFGDVRNITAFVFSDKDPVWADRKSWIWRENPLYENSFVRVISTNGRWDRSPPGL